MTSLFRSSPYIEGFVENVVRQTSYPDFELNVRVVQPTTAEINQLRFALNELKCTVTLSVSDHHESLYETWNEILRRASGDVVAIWNVDDRRTAESLQEQVLTHAADQTAVAVYGPFSVVERLESTEGTIPDLADADDPRLGREMHLGPFFSFRRSVLSDLKGFDEQLKIAGDFDFAIRLHSVGRLRRVDSHLGFFLDAGQGLSTRSAFRRMREVRFVVNRYRGMSGRSIARLYQPRLEAQEIVVRGQRHTVTAS